MLTWRRISILVEIAKALIDTGIYFFLKLICNNVKT
jgi:hypothetical protein